MPAEAASGNEAIISGLLHRDALVDRDYHHSHQSGVTPMTAQAFKAARDFLLAHRTDYITAYRDFRWPEMDRFNWALDWFDRELARGDTARQPALIVVGEGAARLTFAELSERSNRVANGLRALGVKRGD